jgi:hypothetical protein
MAKWPVQMTKNNGPLKLLKPVTPEMQRRIWTETAHRLDNCRATKFIWVNYFITHTKVAGSIPNEVIAFLIALILTAAIWPWGQLSL